MPAVSSLPAATGPARLRRLRGRSRFLPSLGAVSGTTLWTDGTQLIHARTRGSVQDIQRFQLAAIQAIQLRRTAQGLTWNLILAGVLLLVLFIAWSVSAAEDFPWRATVVGTPLAVLLLINALGGPTCRAYLMTDPGPQHLAALERLRPSLRAIDAISSAAEALQGAIPPAEVVVRVDRMQTERLSRSPTRSARETAPRRNYDY